MRNITATQNRLFIDKLTRELIKLGAINNTTDWLKDYPLMINTKGGLLYLKIDNDNISSFTLYTQFQDMDKAKEVNILPLSKLNPKWNFHIVKQYNDAIKEIIEDITKII